MGGECKETEIKLRKLYRLQVSIDRQSPDHHVPSCRDAMPSMHVTLSMISSFFRDMEIENVPNRWIEAWRKSKALQVRNTVQIRLPYQ